MSSFLRITVHFIDATWKLCSFVLAADSFLEKHTDFNIAKAYDNVIEKFYYVILQKIDNFNKKHANLWDNPIYFINAKLN